jgi:hypothetical protein
MRPALTIILLVAGCAGPPAAPPPPHGCAAPAQAPAPSAPIASAWLLGSGGFMGQQCVSIWVDASGAASLKSISADENSFTLAPGFHARLLSDLAQAWPLADQGVALPGDDLIRYTLLITAADGTTRSFTYSDGAAKPPVLERIHASMISIVGAAAPR